MQRRHRGYAEGRLCDSQLHTCLAQSAKDRDGLGGGPGGSGRQGCATHELTGVRACVKGE